MRRPASCTGDTGRLPHPRGNKRRGTHSANAIFVGPRDRSRLVREPCPSDAGAGVFLYRSSRKRFLTFYDSGPLAALARIMFLCALFVVKVATQKFSSRRRTHGKNRNGERSLCDDRSEMTRHQYPDHPNAIPNPAVKVDQPALFVRVYVKSVINSSILPTYLLWLLLCL